MRSRVGLADLALVIGQLGAEGEEAEALASLLGYAYQPPSTEPKRERERGSSEGAPVRSEASPSASDHESLPWAPIPFWRLERYEVEEPEPQEVEPPSEAPDLGRDPWRRAPEAAPIAPWSSLFPRLEAAAGVQRPVGRVDVRTLVDGVARLRTVTRVPRQLRFRWPAQVTVLVDRHPRIAPFWEDQDFVLRHIERALGTAVTVRWLTSGPPAVEELEGLEGCWALSDLGHYGTESEQREWARLGLGLAKKGTVCAALLPRARHRGEALRVEGWRAVAWEEPGAASGSDEEREAAVEAVLELLAPCVRIEPGLLREVRRLLPSAVSDVETEAAVWGHPALQAGRLAAAWRSEESPRYKARLEESADAPRVAQAYACVRAWHEGVLPVGLWEEEQASFLEVERRCGQAIVGSEEAARVDAYLRRLLETARSKDAEASGAALDYVARATSRLSEAVLAADWRRTGEAPNPWAQLSVLASRRRGAGRVGRGMRPSEVDAGGDAHTPVRTWQIAVEGERLVFGLDRGDPARALARFPAKDVVQLGATGGPTVQVELREGAAVRLRPGDVVEIAEHAPAGSEEVPWKPSWAARAGYDQYGAWAEVDLGEVAFKLRYVAPGTFLMGSPRGEEGRWDHEGPQHLVTLTRGYWIAETPCTQPVWEAVMGENPSRFVSPTRPVEQVSFEDCVRFLERLNGRVAGLEARLPSEAEWEHACRAGTTTSTYEGQLEIRGEHDGPILDAIAWYGGNSGEGYELANGADSSGWEEKQYPHTKAGTRPVAEKAPNAWGLYDMLGNVYEWCADDWYDYTSASATDPLHLRGLGAYRVGRGGSWRSYARSVRAAYRYQEDPSYRNGDFGFRLARGQAPGEGSPGAEPRREAGAKVGRDAAPGVIVVSERARLLLGAFEQPRWARSLGRDRFGLWALVDFEPTFRLRYIPPGRFPMGSPDTDAACFDDETLHEVTLTRGYWLAETPCTQALWEAVMGENPSRFRSPTRPVEQANWEECHRFLEALNRAVPDLVARLPTEAEWEHGCRAGTTTSTYAGDLEILGENNGPVLDAIAWYGGNSGVGFELAEGNDSSPWPEKQHDHRKAGTRPVGQRRPNGFGLYDMLGNVWEWCEDAYGPLGSDRVSDPLVLEGATRVFRGSSWLSIARYVRAACRRHVDPSDRHVSLGFRLARGLAESEAETGRGAEARRSPGADPPGVPEGGAPSGQDVPEDPSVPEPAGGRPLLERSRRRPRRGGS